ncbi:MAG: thiamine phosphate synthase [Candidatus Binatia bacterium]
MSNRLASRLFVVTDRAATRGRPLRDVVRAALAGGARLVQLREKDLDGGNLLALAEPLVADCHEVGAQLLVNDRVDVALAAGADGVVLPADSFPTEVARQLLGSGASIGRSTHASAEVERAAREGCDFALFGPVHATPAKAAFGPPQGLEQLREASTRGVAVFAIGGITAANARQAIEAGAHGVAVVREIMSAADPRGAVESLLAALGETRAA